MPYVVTRPCLYEYPDGHCETFLPGRDGFEVVVHDDDHPAIRRYPECFRRDDAHRRGPKSDDLEDLLDELEGGDDLPSEPIGLEPCVCLSIAR
jgi:hypothetical protein